MDKILGLDLGTTTVGVAVGRPNDTFIFTRPVINFSKGNYRYARSEVLSLCEKERITTIVLGYPLNVDGREGERAKSVKRFKSDLLSECPNLEIILVDERYSTLEAEERLKRLGYKQAKIKELVDSEAAKIILETYFARLKEKEND